MKQIAKFLLLVTVIGFTSCSPKITSNFTNPQPKLSIDEKAAFLDLEHNPPGEIIKLGSIVTNT